MNYVDGELAMLQPTSGGGYVRVGLTNANTGSQAAFSTQNYEPKPLPVPVGGYYWVVFASFRTDAYPTLVTPKKLWVTAISPGATPGTDASHPAVHADEPGDCRAAAVAARLLGTGAVPGDGVELPDGQRLLQRELSAAVLGGRVAVLVCGTPSTGCVQNGGRCTAGQSQQCCNAAQGVQCIGTLNGYGTCNAPGGAQ